MSSRTTCISAVASLSLLFAGAAEGHGGVVHTGLTTTAIVAMQHMGDAITGPVDRIPLPPADVNLEQWRKFYFDAKIAYRNLTTAAGDSPGGTPTQLTATLGSAANQPDHNVNDTHMWWKLDNSLLLGTGKALLDDVFKGSLAVTVVPIYCVCSCILSIFTDSASCKKCLSGAKNLINDVPTPSDLLSAIPGVGDISKDDFTGLWHFINLNPLRSNDYDDHQGMLYTEAGPLGIPGVVDIQLLALSDIFGWSIRAAKSEGTRYQRPNPGDAYPDGDSYDGSIVRSDNKWQGLPFAHVPFSPVDNLGLWGWESYRTDPKKNLAMLGYPIHAIGDATVPMHVNGTTSWGHRPFEDAYGKLWSRGRISLSEDVVIAKAFKYRQEVLKWRTGASSDVPVRHLIRAVGRNTWTYSVAIMAATEVSGYPAWPFNDLTSIVYMPSSLADWKPFGAAATAATAVYEDRPDAVALGKPLLEDGAAAILALLVSAADTPSTGQTPYAGRWTPPSPPAAGSGASGTGVTVVRKRPVPAAPGDGPPADSEHRHEYAILAARFILGELSQADYLAQLAKLDSQDTPPPSRRRTDSVSTGVTDEQMATLKRLLLEQQARTAPELKRWFAGSSILYAPQCVGQAVPAAPIRFHIWGHLQQPEHPLALHIPPSPAATSKCPVFYLVELVSAKPGDGRRAMIALRNTEAVGSDKKSGDQIYRLAANMPLTPDRAEFVELPYTLHGPGRMRLQAINSIGQRSDWSGWFPIDFP